MKAAVDATSVKNMDNMPSKRWILVILVSYACRLMNCSLVTQSAAVAVVFLLMGGGGDG